MNEENLAYGQGVIRGRNYEIMYRGTFVNGKAEGIGTLRLLIL